MITYYKEIFSYVIKMVSNKNTANDITQETFTRVIKANQKNKIKNERAFLYRVAKNIMIDQFRQNTKFTQVSFDEDSHIENTNNSEIEIIQEDQQKLLREEIDNLAKKRKQAFVLHIMEGYSRQEVASMMGLSLNAVEKHISRASNQIKENISKKEGNDFE